jgi:formiminoglutamase
VQRFFEGEKVGIINFDAHFDVRSYEQLHSGCSFRMISDRASREGFTFNYLPVGIRTESNAVSLFDFMHTQKQPYILLDEVQQELETVNEKIRSFIDGVDKIYITVDLDCFPSSYAPGVSAAAPDGILPSAFKHMLSFIVASGKVTSFDLVELNPTLDVDNRTAKLAAVILHHFLNYLNKRIS